MPTIRKARFRDLDSILGLVREFAQKELMLPLSVGDVVERLRDFWIAEEADGTIVGCAALHVTWIGLMEIRSIAVREGDQGKGVGRRLMETALEEARSFGTSSVFVLTYVPGFFARFGFREVERDTLPQKVWQDCTKCPKYPDCGEMAMAMAL